MMSGGARILGILALVLLCASPGSAEVIDFSDVLLGQPFQVFGAFASFQSQGFTFTSASFTNLVDAASDSDPTHTPADGHSVFVVQDSFGIGGGAFAPTAGGTFGLTSLDAVWWRGFALNFVEDFTITGHFAGGSTQSVNGQVSLGNFDSLVLNWANLDSVSFTTSGGFGWFALGNINVQTDAPASVPETGSGLLLAMSALLALAFRRAPHHSA